MLLYVGGREGRKGGEGKDWGGDKYHILILPSSLFGRLSYGGRGSCSCSVNIGDKLLYAVYWSNASSSQ